MAASIPASAIVNVTPNVIGAGGTALDLCGLFLTNSARPPIGTVQRFTSTAAVVAYFGAGSVEAVKAAVYFNGFDNSNVKPALVLYAQYPSVAVPAFLRGGSIASMTLTALQALSGTIIVTINGQVITSSTITLSAATSFSNAAALIQTGLAGNDAAFTGVIAAGVLTASSLTAGAIYPGQILTGTGVTAGTTIGAQLTGTTGAAGTYTVVGTTTASSTAMKSGATLVTYDSVLGAFVITGGTPGAVSTIGYASGTLAAGIMLTQATAAVTSQGAAAAVPGTFMGGVIAQTQDFVSFSTTFEPTTADQVLFAAWTGAQANRYLYCMWDTDITATTNANTTTAGYQIVQAGYAGTAMLYTPTDTNIDAFLMGSIAAIDFNQIEGRTNIAFKSQAGQTATVTNKAIGDQLVLNGYNFYGAYATANNPFTFLYPGSVTGPFLWIDSYVNQIWLNEGFQLDLMQLLTSLKSIPYNAAGYALIEAALHDRIEQALTFGAIRAGITLSALQVAQVNAAAGLVIAPTLQQRGWYLQVADAAPSVRAARGSPPVTFWYMDGQSIQKISLTSVQVQ